MLWGQSCDREGAVSVLLQWCGGCEQVLIMTPTRELAVQVAGEVARLQGGDLSQVALFVQEAPVRALG